MEQIVRFVNLLRQMGFSIGTDELIALTQSHQLLLPLGNLGGQDFKTVLQALLVKDHRDFPLFDLLFDAFFRDGQSCLETAKDSWKSELLETRGSTADGRGLAASGKGGANSKLSHLVHLGYYSQAAQVVHEAVGQIDCLELSGPELLAAAKLKLDWNMEQYELEKLLRGAIYPEKELLEGRWSQLEQLLNREIAAILLKRNRPDDIDQLNKLFNYKEKNLGGLNGREQQIMKREAMALGRKLATRKNRHWKKSNRGSIDLKETIGNCLKGGGVPIKLYRRRHKISRPHLVLLCDVSSSVVSYSAFMLLLVYSMEQSQGKIRSFIFVDDLEDVSPYFKKYGIEEGVEHLAAKATCSTSGFSDFGRVFRIFEQKHLGLLTAKTNLIILGDAKNNYKDAQLSSFINIVNRCQHTWWLNPQPRELWNQDDSIISQYEPYCTELWECNSLEQLRRIIQRIYI